jgi:hypothetical protein
VRFAVSNLIASKRTFIESLTGAEAYHRNLFYIATIFSFHIERNAERWDVMYPSLYIDCVASVRNCESSVSDSRGMIIIPRS